MIDIRGHMDLGAEITLSPDPLDLSTVAAFLMENHGAMLRIKISKYYKSRTLNQNSFFHKAIQIIATETKQPFDLVKEGIKWRAADEYGYPWIINEISKRRHPKPSSQCNTKEMGILLDATFAIAAEEQITGLLAFYREYEEWKDQQEKHNYEN
jgi:hypothetical protein